MVRWESVVIAVVGAIVGSRPRRAVGLGVHARAASQGLSVFRFPRRGRCSSSSPSVIAGVLAAVLPAWRASRLDVLEAIATE